MRFHKLFWPHYIEDLTDLAFSTTAQEALRFPQSILYLLLLN